MKTWIELREPGQAPERKGAFMTPGSLEREILDRYCQNNVPALRLSARPIEDQMVTVMDIRIPELGFRRALHS